MDEAPAEYADDATWDRRLLHSPESALAMAEQLRANADPIERVRLLRVAARALFELGRLDDARATIDDARALLSVGQRDAHLRSTVIMTATIIYAEAGDVASALDMLADLERESDGRALGRIKMQLAYVLQHAGRLPEALAALDQSDRLFGADGLSEERFRVHLNRGLVLLQGGSLSMAEADFRAAADVARRLGVTASEGQCWGNLGVLFGRARRLHESLDAFDRADRLLAAAGRPARIAAGVEIDRAEVQMHAGLVADAVASARQAVRTAEESASAMLIGDALLMCARTELAAGDLRRARTSAATAADVFSRSGRADMLPHADSVVAHAELRDASDPDRLSSSQAVLDRLRALGWHQQVDELQVERLRTARRLGAWGAVGADIAELRRYAGGTSRDRELIGWFAEAIGRALGGDASGSVEACRAGLDVVDRIMSEAVDLEHRSAALRLGADLSRWIIGVAVDVGDADLALVAGEGTRGRALADELDSRERHRPLTDEGAAQLRTELRGRLAHRCLVQWIVAAGRVHAVVADEQGNRLVDVADVATVVRERDRLTVWLDRAAEEPDGSSARAQRAAGLLDELLLGPLELPADDAIVVIPVDELHGVPWSGLPSIADRPVMISPSCRLWLDADRRAAAPITSVGFIAGPRLTQHDVERTTVLRCYERVDEAAGAGATAATVRTMFGNHDLVHVAAHGRFRADRPLFSTFELADGEVTLHESVPAQVHSRLAVLSSCEGGAHSGPNGSEVLGLASVLLARGAASVLAPLTVVRELECGEFVAAVHEELTIGTRFGAAVAAVRGAWLRDDDLSRWAVASSFCCFGSEASGRPAPS